jgi:hypothetical protein
VDRGWRRSRGARIGDLPDASTSHVCPIQAAHRQATRPGLVSASWCFSSFRDRLASVLRAEATGSFPRELCLWSQDALEVYYAPFDQANPDARVVLVGITPGEYQMRRAWAVAAELASSDMPDAEVLAAAKASASFSGPMRDFLVWMLDEVGIADGLHIDSTGSLWGADQRLASFTSVICFPTFIDGRNFNGESPRIERIPVLREFAELVLAADLSLTANAIVIPLGKRPAEWVERLVREGRIESGRCLIGVPHPSPANGHRMRLFAERREALREQASTYFAG